jgi:hypothetical protein
MLHFCDMPVRKFLYDIEKMKVTAVCDNRLRLIKSMIPDLPDLTGIINHTRMVFIKTRGKHENR